VNDSITIEGKYLLFSRCCVRWIDVAVMTAMSKSEEKKVGQAKLPCAYWRNFIPAATYSVLLKSNLNPFLGLNDMFWTDYHCTKVLPLSV